MIREVACQAAIDYEHLPDGKKAPVIDAYDGNLDKFIKFTENLASEILQPLNLGGDC